MSMVDHVRLCCLPALWLLAGCQVELPKPTDIQFDRPLGARASVVDADEPLLATPSAGQRARYEVAIAFDDPLGGDVDALSSLFIVCTAPEQFTGIPLCLEFLQPGFDLEAPIGGPPGPGMPAGMPAGMPQSLTCDGTELSFTAGPFFVACVPGVPTFEFPVEESFEEKRKLILGVICQGGQPYLDPDPDSQRLLRCRDNVEGGETMDVYGTVVVEQSPEDRNLNPDLQPLQITLADDPWDAPGAQLPEVDCGMLESTAALPHIDAKAADPHVIGLAYDAALITDRVEGQREQLEIGAHATIKGIERRFTLFQSDKSVDEDGMLTGEVEFEVDEDEELTRGGQLVRFFFTARDKRGGFDVIERVACVE